MAFFGYFTLVFVFLYFNSGQSELGLTPKSNDVTDKDVNITAFRVCKPGPPLSNLPVKTSKRCLVIGDSVSIGYTAWLKTALHDVCEVYHAPWDNVDGGALDTKYTVQCLPLFLVSNLQEKIQYDVIVFNFGLHDVNFDNNSPEEFTDKDTYRKDLTTIKESLQGTGSHVGYILTTPVPFNVTTNDRVKRYNEIAREVMASGKPVPIADLYFWVVLVCGEPPYNSCVIADKQPSPHYTKEGYKYLSILIANLIRNIQIPVKKEITNKNEPKENMSVLSCTNKAGKTVTKCPQTMTCSPSKYSMSGWGCCPSSNANSCKDVYHCCPEGYECDPSCTVDLCFCIKKQTWLQ